MTREARGKNPYQPQLKNSGQQSRRGTPGSNAIPSIKKYASLPSTKTKEDAAKSKDGGTKEFTKLKKTKEDAAKSKDGSNKEDAAKSKDGSTKEDAAKSKDGSNKEDAAKSKDSGTK